MSRSATPHGQPGFSGRHAREPALTRREVLKALAATSLAGCSGEVVERAVVAATSGAVVNAAESSEPAWISAVPTISFSEGAPLTYDLRQYTRGFDPARHEMALAADSAALPAGVTLDPTGWLRYDGSNAGARVSGIVIDINDRTGSAAAPVVTSGSQGALATFAARIASPGVVRHFAFDSPAHLGAGPGGFGYGHNYGWYDDGGGGGNNNDHPVHDAAVFPPGGGGSLRFELDATRGGGQWVTNFSEDLKTRYNAGDEFFVQWRQRFDANYLGPNSNGAYMARKQALISSGDINYTVAGIANSCRCCEICVQSYEFGAVDDPASDLFPILYHRCPNCGGTLNMTTAHPQQFLLMQNTMPAPFCGYNNVHVNGNGTNAPSGNCFIYYPNEWMTFQVGVTCGNRVGDTLENSRVRFWMQRQGQPSAQVIDFPLTLTVPAVDPGYGKFWFMNYNAHPRNNVWKTWCSELIISRQRIPDAL
jgi:hypothetical protein